MTLSSGLSSRVLMVEVRLIGGRGSAAFHEGLVLQLWFETMRRSKSIILTISSRRREDSKE